VTLRSTQRGTVYLEAGRTLLRTAQAVIDSVIAARLKSLADDYQSQDEKRSRLDQPNGIGSIGCQQLR
jgi:hypothetical protein